MEEREGEMEKKKTRGKNPITVRAFDFDDASGPRRGTGTSDTRGRYARPR